MTKKIATTVNTKEGASVSVYGLYRHTWDWLVYRDRNPFPHSSGGWEVTAKCYHRAQALLLCQSVWKARERKSKRGQIHPFSDGTNATQRMESSWLNRLCKVPSLILLWQSLNLSKRLGDNAPSDVLPAPRRHRRMQHNERRLRNLLHQLRRQLRV